MRMSLHPSHGVRPHPMPSRGLMITEGLAALVLLVALVAGVAMALTWGVVLAIGFLLPR